MKIWVERQAPPANEVVIPKADVTNGLEDKEEEKKTEQ